MKALACPASLKGVLAAREAAAAVARGFRRGGIEAEQMPVADGGEGSLEALHAARGGEWREIEVADAFGRPRQARWLLMPGDVAAVEAAQAVPIDHARLDPMTASSRGLGELILAVGRPRALLVCLGGTATVDGGTGLLEVVERLPAPTRVACDVAVPLLDAARLFSAQKGATPAQSAELEERLAGMTRLAPYAELPGAGAAGGLGAALASLGAELVPGAALILDELGFEPARFELVVTGEGTVDRTTARGKAPFEVARRSRSAGVRCVVFGGRVTEQIAELETVELSGDPRRADEDLAELGERLARSLLDLA
jgi:glycerate kinase